MKVRLESTSGSSDLQPDVGDARFHGGISGEQSMEFNLLLVLRSDWIEPMRTLSWFFPQQSLMLWCSTKDRNCSRVNLSTTAVSYPRHVHNDTYSMYSLLFSFVTMISDPLGFRST